MYAIRRPRFRSAPMATWAAVLVVALLAALVWATFAHRLRTATPVPHVDVPAPNAVVWHGHVYQSEATLARDLQRQGGSYAVWAANHRTAAAFLARLSHEKR